MDAFVIRGGRRLRGRVKINGSKNAMLPEMAAALLTNEPVTLLDVADLADTRNMSRLLAELGCEINSETVDGRRCLKLHTTDEDTSTARYDIVRTMRASICTLGPLLAKRGYAKVSMPGGCNIGDRPVDLHIRGVRALGAEVTLENGYIIAEAKRLKGARIFLGGAFGSTVLGTANVMSAATLAEGTTVIESAACEPEVQDLAMMLNAMGAKITGAGSPRVTIEGVESLHAVDHAVIPDRIEAGTWAMAAAITNGEIILDHYPTDFLTAVDDTLASIGVDIEPVELSASDPEGDRVRQSVRVSSRRRLSPATVVTQPYPGFPTDLQAQLMALVCFSDGNSMVTEKIFPDRFLHVAELLRMGANMIRNGPTVLVTGTQHLIGAPVMASDLRASAGLVLAALAARDETVVNRVYHLDRGYEKMELALQQLGADIERVNIKE